MGLQSGWQSAMAMALVRVSLLSLRAGAWSERVVKLGRERESFGRGCIRASLPADLGSWDLLRRAGLARCSWI